MQVTDQQMTGPVDHDYYPNTSELDQAIATCDGILRFSTLSDSAKSSAFKARTNLARIRKEVDKLNENKLRGLRPAPKPKPEPAVTAESVAKAAAEAIAQAD